MTSTAKQTMYNEIKKHGENLNAIFNTKFPAIALCKKLHSLENKAHSLCEFECNTGRDMDEQLNAILLRVKKTLGVKDGSDIDKAIFINGDPRGYTLKIKDSYVRANNLKIHTDWGGYGIISPDFTPNN